MSSPSEWTCMTRNAMSALCVACTALTPALPPRPLNLGPTPTLTLVPTLSSPKPTREQPKAVLVPCSDVV